MSRWGETTGKLRLIGLTLDGAPRSRRRIGTRTRVAGPVVPILRTSLILACATNLRRDRQSILRPRRFEMSMANDVLKTSIALVHDQSLSRRMLGGRVRRFFIAAVAVGGLVPACSMVSDGIAMAEHPQPANRLGRVAGAGWSDGYHACESSGARLLADLPPVGYAQRMDLNRTRLATHCPQASTAPATYYDHFDRACDEAAAYSEQSGLQTMSVGPAMSADAPTPMQEIRYQDPEALRLWQEQERLRRELELLELLEEQRRAEEYRVFEKYRVDKHDSADEEHADEEHTEPTKIDSSTDDDLLHSTPLESTASESTSLESTASESTPPKSTASESKPIESTPIPESDDLLAPDSPQDSATPNSDDSIQPSPSDLLRSDPRHSATPMALALDKVLAPEPTPVALPKVEMLPKPDPRPQVVWLPKSRPVTGQTMEPVTEAGAEPATDLGTTATPRIATIESLIIRQPQ